MTFGCLACSEPSTTPPERIIEGPYTVTASLNDSTWFGGAYAYETSDITGQIACALNRFDIGFSTDLPFDTYPPKRPVTGCLGDCIATQLLRFHRIPLAIGKYEVSTLNSYAGGYGAVDYYQLGEEITVDSYNSQTSKIGWIEITAYNRNQKAVEGTFEIELTNRDAKTAHFKKGIFKAF